MLELEDTLSQLQNLLVSISRVGVGSGMRRTRGPSLDECRTCCLLGGSRWQRRTARWTARARPRCIAAISWSHCRCVTDTVGVYTPSMPHYTPSMPHTLLLVFKQERALVPLTLATVATHLASASAGLHLIDCSGLTLICGTCVAHCTGFRARQKPPSQEPTERPLGMVQLVLSRADLASGRQALPC